MGRGTETEGGDQEGVGKSGGNTLTRGGRCRKKAQNGEK